MATRGTPLEGGCRCGQVRFRLDAAPVITMACHCTGCQRMTGGPYSLSVLVAEGAFELTAGEPVIGGMHGEIRHFHCPHCLSWMFTRPPGAPFVNVRTPMLDEPKGFAPFVETGLSQKLPWVAASAPRGFPMFPDPTDWPELMQGYAATRG